MEAQENGQTLHKRLGTIFGLARILASQEGLETMATRLLASLVDTLEAADAGLLTLYDPTSDGLRVAAASGYAMEGLKDLCFAPGESISGRAFQSGVSELYRSPAETAQAMDNLSPANRDILQAATLGAPVPLSAIAIPLVAGEEKVGVLVLENLRRPASFSPADQDFLQAVADLIALSINSARLQRELRDTQAISEANRLKADLISVLAHEMRTPLTSIKGYSTALLMDEIAFNPETQREFLQIIDEECDVLQDLIRDLLESSVIDAGLLKLELQPVKLERLTHDVMEDIAHRARRHRLLTDFPPRFPLVEADPDRIAQVLRNLLDNAIKYSPAGGLIIVRGEARPQEVVISVADQGVGISPEDLNRLFERFFRVQSGQHIVGSGLGLPISRTIVESHGGRIWAESQPGQGSTFYFTLPRRRDVESGGEEP